jgi:hypothetical protein
LQTAHGFRSVAAPATIVGNPTLARLAVGRAARYMTADNPTSG